MIKNIKKKLPKIIFACFIAYYLFIYREWAFSFSILTHTDWWFFHKETMITILLPFFTLWIDDFSFGRILIEIGQAPIYVWYGILAKYFNLDFSVIERIIHLWPILIFTPLSSFLLLKNLFKNEWAILCGVLVYSFNTYFLTLQTGHITLMTSYSFAPLILLSYKKTLEEKSTLFTFLTGILLFISSAYEPRAFFIIIMTLFLYFVFHLFVFSKLIVSKKIIKTFIFGGLPIFIVFLLNFYWILGLSKTDTLISNKIFERGLFGNEFLNILHAITLSHPYWTGSKTAVFELQSIPIYFWIIPLLSFAGFLLNRKNKYIFYFALIAILGILLTKQVGRPFSFLYPFLYENVPGFNAFREASKFYFLIVFGYSVLIASLIERIHLKSKNTRGKNYLKHLITGVVIVLFAWNSKPIITGEIGTLFQPRHIPKEYITLNNYINKQADYFRVLWIPTHSRWGNYTNNHPLVSLVNTINGEWSQFVLKDREKDDFASESELMMKILNKPFSDDLLDMSSIKYVVIPSEDKENDNNFFVYYGKTIKQEYVKNIDKLEYLHKIDIDTKGIEIYVNYNYRPHLYLTEKREKIGENNSVKKIDYAQIHPTEYRLSLRQVKEPIYLNFTESFHPGWKLRVGNFNWWEAILNDNYFLPEEIHQKSDTGLHSFYLDPKIVCKVDNVGKVHKEECVRNKDGTYNIQITLFFKPQAYLYAGGIVSISTLVAVLSYLGYLGIVTLRNRNNSKTKQKLKI